ncbi:hypothetical protein GPECTOR_87g406 [Gonium pectorale]|uniref:Uncharacterized protein n=1 Tax=Gonium pectorale TaxID=33097 RepID=A0A150G130_GONPE|nr:hypothetical protein GPECTOR_87g406 [Gonium pectorale]|eukprot:KXZ43544.1 hypothetical protein GPECTOR_87g406 [Gonium pectorale]
MINTSTGDSDLRRRSQVPVELPEVLEARVRKYPGWPKSRYLVQLHKVECGCEECKKLQEAGAADRGRGRASTYSQRRGYWTPARFVEHVVGFRLGGRQQPPGVPKLRCEDHLRLVFPVAGEEDEENEDRRVEMAPSQLKKNFGYRWQCSSQD